MKEPIPQERTETIRQEIMGLLDGRTLSAGALSKAVGKSEKEIYAHLDQLQKSGLLIIIPAECSHCGYTFENRDRTKKPGKCPDCKSTHIDQPLFTLTPR